MERVGQRRKMVVLPKHHPHLRFARAPAAHRGVNAIGSDIKTPGRSRGGAPAALTLGHDGTDRLRLGSGGYRDEFSP